MRHLELRDLWLQKEVRDGKLEMEKLNGKENSADLMAKILTIAEIRERLQRMNIYMGMTEKWLTEFGYQRL
eukprot:5248532-Karenia_brevis.AAC.1